MAKFDIGDKVKIIHNNSHGGYKIGDICIIYELSKHSYRIRSTENKKVLNDFYSDHDLMLVSKDPEKKAKVSKEKLGWGF